MDDFNQTNDILNSLLYNLVIWRDRIFLSVPQNDLIFNGRS